MSWSDRQRSWPLPSDDPPAATVATAGLVPFPVATVATRHDGETRDDGYGFHPLPWFMQSEEDRPASSLFCDAPLPDEALTILFRFSGVARRYVELPAKRGTRKGWTVPEVPEDEHRRLKVFARVKQAITWARLYGGGPVLMVTEDDLPRRFRAGSGGDPRQWLLEPLDLRRVGKLVALHPFDACQAHPLGAGGSPWRPGFREPTYWQLISPEWYGTVHASRVAWFRGNERPPSQIEHAHAFNTMPDDSVLQVGWRALERLVRTMDAGAELAENFREAIVKIAGLAAKATGDEAAALQARLRIMDEFRRLSGLVVLGDGDSYESRTHSPVGFEGLAGTQSRMLAADFGWPQRLLYGDGPGGLSTNDEGAAEQERQIVSECMEDHRDTIETIYRVLFASQDGPTGGEEPDEWSLTFAPLDEPDEKTLAETRRTVAETDKIYLETGVLSPAFIAERRFREDGFQFELGEAPVPDSDDELEARMQREREREQRQVGPEEDDEEPILEREDAAGGGGCIVLVPAVDPGLLDAVERALGQRLSVWGEPHVTVLYLGKDLSEEAVAEVIGVTTEEAERTETATLQRPTLRTFKAGEDGTPVVLEFQDGWPLSYLNERLLRRLAHRVQVKQYPRYRAHLTIGYAPEAPSPEAMAALLAIDVSAVQVPVAQLLVRNGDTTVATIQVGG